MEDILLFGHNLRCECSNCKSERKIIAESWAVQRQLDRAKQNGDSVKIKKSEERISELNDQIKKLEEDALVK